MWPHDIKCPTNMSRPEPVGVCDRCYTKRFLVDLIFQWDYRGNSLQNLRIRVCKDRCLDVPADQRRPVIITGTEGVVKDPRPPQYAQNAQGGPPPPTTIRQLLFGNIGDDQ
jgi:hypothetical protein